MTDAPWAMPEAVPSGLPSRDVDGDGGDRASGAGLEPARPARTGPAAPAVVPALAVFIRPLTISDVLDGGFEVIKARPRTVLTIAACFVLPLSLLIAAYDPGIFGGDALTSLTDPDTYDEGAQSSDGNLGLTIISTLVTSLLVTLMAAPIARLVEAWYTGGDLTATAACRSIGKGWFSVVIAFVAVHLIEGVGTVLLVLPGLVAMTFLLVTAPAIAVERVGPLRALRRSFQLVRPRFWSVLWIALLVGLIAGTLNVLLPLLPLAAASLIGFGGLEYVAAAGTVAASLLTLPFTAAVAVMVYFDLRVRNEGLDLQVALAANFGDRS